MKKELKPFKKIVITGILQAVLFGVFLLILNHFADKNFTIPKIIFFSVAFGLIMAYVQRYKSSK